MKEAAAMAYVNMYGVLGALEDLCRLDGKAKRILAEMGKPAALCLSVRNGPCATFHFDTLGCRMTEGSDGCDCRMHFFSPEAFNALIARGKPGVPVRGLIRTLRFLTGPFTQLTNRLSEVLQPKEEALKDPAFFEENTVMTLYVIAGSISALANSDSISRVSASYTVDGEIYLGIRGTAGVTLSVKDHRFTTVKAVPEHPMAIMEFDSVELANGLFAGTVSAVNEVCRGTIRVAGMISMVDNVNRILDRVAVYLA